jgi:ParB family chromosome partitioning protein
MAHFMVSQSAAVKEAEELRERLKAFDGATPVLAMDPRLVQPSRWANRHEDAYADAAFAELKAEIASAGGNVQPVSVRRLKAVPAAVAPAVDGPGAAAPLPTHELVFGHRRHRACLELGLPLQAMVVDVADQALFEAMERENRARKNLSAWEQGCMYKRALDEGLYPSQRKLSEALAVDVSLVSKSLSLARLPVAVVKAFGSPLEIQFRWAQPLADALQRDPEGVLARAARMQQAGGKQAPAAVLAQLLGQGDAGVLNRSTPTHLVIQGVAGRQALLTRDGRDRVVVKFPAGALTPAAQAELAAQIETLLSRG